MAHIRRRQCYHFCLSLIGSGRTIPPLHKRPFALKPLGVRGEATHQQLEVENADYEVTWSNLVFIS
jgi:hypothetical protein